MSQSRQDWLDQISRTARRWLADQPFDDPPPAETFGGVIPPCATDEELARADEIVSDFWSHARIIAEAESKWGPDETRIVDPDTGGAKGKKLERYDLLPAGPLEHVARHYGRGAEKYDDHNWRLGYAWSLSFAAMQRHLWAFWGGEDLDAETGSPHLAAAVFHCLALMEYATTHPEKDDRVR